MKHIKYLNYVLRHKWFVFLECCKYRLWWRGVIHDLSKFRPREWLAYAEHFYGKSSHHKDRTHTPVRDKTGYYKPHDTGDDAFDQALFWHLRSNSHHWQFWYQPYDGDNPDCGVALGMPHLDRLEMFCDWHGASRAQGSKSTALEWYQANKCKLRLHPTTRLWVEDSLCVVHGVPREKL